MPRPGGVLHGDERTRLLNALHEKYASKRGWRQRLIYLRKKYGWLLVVGTAKFLKRSFDILVSIFLLVLLSPLMLLIAICIKLTDGGPTLYISTRVGKWGKEFLFPKFRSMYMGADRHKALLREQSIHGNSHTFKIRRDPRVTWIGRIIRKTSLDELPQLWCVLKGEMSLVGPRPPLVEEVELYTIEERRRLDVTPGLTCIWQVSGRGDIPFSKQVKLDLQYIESQSIWLDFKILLQTIPAVIFGRGAY